MVAGALNHLLKSKDYNHDRKKTQDCHKGSAGEVEGFIMSDIKQESGEFVIAHLLTKDSPLSTNDTRILQTGLIETDNAGFDYANGSFGPGTAQAVMDFLSKDENLHIVPRLSDTAQQALSAQGHESTLTNLSQKAIAAGHDPASIEGDTIESLIAQPYPLSHDETVHLQTELHAAGHYKLSNGEDTKYADGTPTKIHPNGVLGASTATGVLSYIENPEAVLENPSIIGHMTSQGEHYESALRSAAQSSSGYGEHVKDLVEANTGSTLSTTNYRLQHMLQSGAYTASAPDGEIGAQGQQAIKAFEADHGGKTASLTCSWQQKDSPETWACNQAKPEGANAVLVPEGQSVA
jgi:peptidoglycan hydrolase-like protein with peptidoglycan-binding domain